jgi:hypothetical protein
MVKNWGSAPPPFAKCDPKAGIPAFPLYAQEWALGFAFKAGRELPLLVAYIGSVTAFMLSVSSRQTLFLAIHSSEPAIHIPCLVLPTSYSTFASLP